MRGGARCAGEEGDGTSVAPPKKPSVPPPPPPRPAPVELFRRLCAILIFETDTKPPYACCTFHCMIGILSTRSSSSSSSSSIRVLAAGSYPIAVPRPYATSKSSDAPIFPPPPSARPQRAHTTPTHQRDRERERERAKRKRREAMSEQQQRPPPSGDGEGIKGGFGFGFGFLFRILFRLISWSRPGLGRKGMVLRRRRAISNVYYGRRRRGLRAVAAFLIAGRRETCGSMRCDAMRCDTSISFPLLLLSLTPSIPRPSNPPLTTSHHTTPQYKYIFICMYVK